MAKLDNRADVDRLKQILTEGWNRILREVPDERVYAFGIYTDECGQSMFAFLLGEKGLERVAKKYIDKGIYTGDSAAKKLRWSTADSPYQAILLKTVHGFNDRPEIYGLAPTAAAREIHYRLTAGYTALRELDEQGLFGTGAKREDITLYIEGGDVNRPWILKWAKKLNPPSVFKPFAKIGTPDEMMGTFTEFGTKKVYDTDQYALSADAGSSPASTQYQLFLFDTTVPKQLFAKALPTKQDYAALGGVSMSGDGKVIAVIPFGGGAHCSEFFIVSGEKGEMVKTVALESRPSAVAVSPTGSWIAITDQSGALNLFDPTGSLLGSHSGHAGWPRGIAVSSNGEMLATGDSKSLIVWDTGNWSKQHKLMLPIDDVNFDPTGQFLAGCCTYPGKGVKPKSAVILDVKTGTVAREVVVDGYQIQLARFSPDGRYLACAMRLDTEEYSGTNTSALVEIESGKVVDRLKADFEQVRDFAFLPHRNEIAVAVFGHTRRPLVLWQPQGLRPA